MPVEGWANASEKICGGAPLKLKLSRIVCGCKISCATPRYITAKTRLNAAPSLGVIAEADVLSVFDG